MKINRRELLSLGAQATMALTAGRFLVTESRAAEMLPAAEDTKFKDAFLALDGFVKQYMREMTQILRRGLLASRIEMILFDGVRLCNRYE